jgi:hypothetical protein
LAFPISYNELLQACRLLFGPDVQLSSEFLSYLQPSGAKSAFRQRVKETHPDALGEFRSAGAAPAATTTTTATAFQDVVASYELIRDFFSQRERGLWRPEPRDPAPSDPSPAGFRAAAAEGSGRVYTGMEQVPERALPTGLFLYYRGIIRYHQLIEALVWQRRQRPNLGDIAQRWGWLKAQHVREILAYRGNVARFGEKAVSLNYLDHRQLTTLLYYQRSQQRKFGQFFVEQGLLSPTAIEDLVAELREHNFQVSGTFSSF